MKTSSGKESQVAHVDRQLATQKLTGSNEADVMGNIYDLEGNNSEWTGFAVSSHLRDARGGRFNFVTDENKFLPASGRTGDRAIGDRCDFGSRVTLYL